MYSFAVIIVLTHFSKREFGSMTPLHTLSQEMCTELKTVGKGEGEGEGERGEGERESGEGKRERGEGVRVGERERELVLMRGQSVRGLLCQVPLALRKRERERGIEKREKEREREEKERGGGGERGWKEMLGNLVSTHTQTHTSIHTH